jgi:hypothetical protein
VWVMYFAEPRKMCIYQLNYLSLCKALLAFPLASLEQDHSSLVYRGQLSTTDPQY